MKSIQALHPAIHAAILRYVFLAVASTAFLELGITRLFAEPPAGQNYVGINIGPCTDFEGNIMFADAMKTSRYWVTIGSGTVLPDSSLDENYWPKVDASIQAWSGLAHDNSGTYALSFESNSDSVHISLIGVTGTVNNVAYNSSTHVTTAQIVLTDATETRCGLSFTNTAGGVRNVKLMRPIAPGNAQSHATPEIFPENFWRHLPPSMRSASWITRQPTPTNNSTGIIRLT